MNMTLVLGAAFSAVGTNKLRTILTLLGIIIGVSSVITLMAIGRGSRSAITDRIEALGTNLLFVSPAPTSDGSVNTLALSDVVALSDKTVAPDIARVAAEVSASAQIIAGRNQTGAQVLGITSNYLEVRDYKLVSGRPITAGDVAVGTDVVLLGSQIAMTLFGNVSPVGQTLKMNGRQYTVIGFLESKGGFGLEDNRVMAPISTVQMRLNGTAATLDAPISQISLQAVNTESADRATDQARLALTLEHETGFDPEDAGFSITNQQDAVDTLEDTNETFVVFLGAIASISLLVGGIGIMNIMLVSVTERTREIGIQRAIGATRRVILAQFVSEATILSFGGGLIGVGIGLSLSTFINGRSIGGFGLDTRLSADIAVLALAVAAVIGLVAGIYPALRAAALDPIEALRHE